MRKRFCCLIFTVALLVSMLLGVRASADGVYRMGMEPQIKLLASSASRTNHRPNALVSAMFLILSGLGVSLLFDKKGE